MKTSVTSNQNTLRHSFEEFQLQIDKWLSELDFISEEISFFKKVVNNYIKTQDTDLQEKVDHVKNEIKAVEQKQYQLKAHVFQYREVVERKEMSKPELSDEKAFDDNLLELHSEFHELNRDIRALKEDLFSITEDIYGN